MNEIKSEIRTEFPEILFNEGLNKYSTFMIGGPADYFYKAKSIQSLQKIIRFAKTNDLNFYVIGGGSNILFDDKGFRGLVIKVESAEYQIKEDEITADAGLMVSKMIKIAIDNDLSGLENWVGLPGTVGGAVRGNAGCNGLETKDILVKAIILNPDTGETTEVNNDYFKYSYRYSLLKENKNIVLTATFKLRKHHLTKEEQEKIMRDIRTFRLTKQPFGLSSGSFFKNPSPQQPAGMLIEQAGLKGFSVGKARVSEKHGNFFINQRGATAADIRQLALHVKAAIKEKFGLDLEEEVQILSEHGAHPLE